MLVTLAALVVAFALLTESNMRSLPFRFEFCAVHRLGFALACCFVFIKKGLLLWLLLLLLVFVL